MSIVNLQVMAVAADTGLAGCTAIHKTREHVDTADLCLMDLDAATLRKVFMSTALVMPAFTAAPPHLDLAADLIPMAYMIALADSCETHKETSE